jgi:hypothetical protein
METSSRSVTVSAASRLAHRHIYLFDNRPQPPTTALNRFASASNRVTIAHIAPTTAAVRIRQPCKNACNLWWGNGDASVTEAASFSPMSDRTLANQDSAMNRHGQEKISACADFGVRCSAGESAIAAAGGAAARGQTTRCQWLGMTQ